MSECFEAPEDSDLLEELINGAMQLHPLMLPSMSRAETQFGTNVTPGIRVEGSPIADPSTSIISSPTVRFTRKKNSGQHEQLNQNNHTSLIPTASALSRNGAEISSGDFRCDASPHPASRKINESDQRKVSQTGHLSHRPAKPALRSIQKSITPARRKHVTSTVSRRHQRLCTTPQRVNPFETLEAIDLKLRTTSQSSQFSNELRRLKLAINIHHCSKIPRAILPRPANSRMLEQPPMPDINQLVLGMLSIIKDQISCSFCAFECIYGSSDRSILLPASASFHTCLMCEPREAFTEGDWATNVARSSSSTPTLKQKIDSPLKVEALHKYRVLIKSPTGEDFYIDVKASEKVVDVKTRVSEYTGIKWDSHHLYSRGVILRDHRLLSAYQIGSRSLIEIIARKYARGYDVTQFLRPNFCSRCLWTQIDAKLAKICMPCLSTKLAIVQHSRHGSWIPFFHVIYDADGDDATATNKQGNCMICTKLARAKCAGCPLVVCVNCSTHLDAICKGELNLLIYSMAPEHIRNDAFLLRSDGGGFQ